MKFTASYLLLVTASSSIEYLLIVSVRNCEARCISCGIFQAFCKKGNPNPLIFYAIWIDDLGQSVTVCIGGLGYVTHRGFII